MRSLTSWSDLDDAVWQACLRRALYHRQSREWTDAAHGKALRLIEDAPASSSVILLGCRGPTGCNQSDKIYIRIFVV